MSEGNLSKETGLASLQRYFAGLDGDICGAVVDMQKHPEGDWIVYENMKNSMAFVTGYLGEHKGLLEDLGAHKKILDSVQYIIDEINKL